MGSTPGAESQSPRDLPDATNRPKQSEPGKVLPGLENFFNDMIFMNMSDIFRVFP